MTSQTKLTKDLIFKMVPQVTTKVNGRSKRALLPFVGDIASNLFGVATEGDVRKLASHINALTKQNNIFFHQNPSKICQVLTHLF
jgi:hypothetical protein